MRIAPIIGEIIAAYDPISVSPIRVSSGDFKYKMGARFIGKNHIKSKLNFAA